MKQSGVAKGGMAPLFGESITLQPEGRYTYFFRGIRTTTLLLIDIFLINYAIYVSLVCGIITG